MAIVTSTLSDYITYLNTLYESSSSTPTAGDEDYVVWTSLANIAINTWENEEGILWNELFVKLADASDGDKTTTAADYSYAVPTLFKFPACGYVWTGTGTTKLDYQIIRMEELQLYENNTDRWCYFLMDTTPTLEFNPNLTLTTGETITYEYYKKATKLSTGTDTFEMSDPMFAVYFALAELKKEEGNAGELQMAMAKLEAMKTKNVMPSWFQKDQFKDKVTGGFGA